MDLTELHDTMKLCVRCPLRRQCNQVVPGIGPANARLVVVGEAPGGDEDLLGEPFVGQAGQLLNKLLKGAGIERDSVYITNTVKCRPKGNATPTDTPIQACKPWLWKELQVIKPKVVLTLGKISTRLLLRLGTSFRMKDVIGQVYDVEYMESKIMSWYHPSYLLHRGLSWDQDTVDFLVKVKEQANGS